MIKKLRLRYLVTNMAILSCTLLVGLAVLFGVLYQTEVSSSYSVMQEMMQESGKPQQNGNPEKAPPPKSDSEGTPPDNAKPQAMTDQPVLAPLGLSVQNADADDTISCEPPAVTDTTEQTEQPQDTEAPDWSAYWKQYWDPGYVAPPFWDYNNPYNPWMNPWMNPWQGDGGNSGGGESGGDSGNTEPGTTAQQQGQYFDPNFNPWAYWGGGEDPNKKQSEPPQSSVTTTGTDRRDPHNPPDGSAMTSASGHPGEQRHEHETTVSSSTAPSSESSAPTTATTAAAALRTEPVVTAVTTASTQRSTETTTTKAQLVPVEEGQFIPDAYVAKIGDDGSIESYSGNNGDTDDEERFRTIHHAMDAVKERGTESGTIEIGDKPYRYLYQKDGSGAAHLVLLDRSMEISTLSRLLLIFFLITVIGLIGMFFLSMLLANWTVTPVASAWEKQKQFVADASHELKTPLAVISANTEVVLANPKESVAQSGKWLNYIQSETMRMSKLISDLLSVASMDQSNVRTPAEPISLSDLVTSICMVFDPIVYEHGKALKTVIQKNVSIRAEENNIRQLLSILLDNAVLHSVPKAQITVTLTQDSQGKIRLAVANTAKDIPPEQLAHLFDRFYRVDTAGSPNGSGLGLSIAKSIVHQMGGKLTVTSENQLVTFLAVLN